MLAHEWVILALGFCLERCCLLCTCSQVLHMSMSSAWNTKITQGWLSWLRQKVCLTSCPASGGQEQLGASGLPGWWNCCVSAGQVPLPLAPAESFIFEGTELFCVFTFSSKRNWKVCKMRRAEGCFCVQNQFQLSHESTSFNPTNLVFVYMTCSVSQSDVLDFKLL